jgi:PTH1 family peptidyl-tRNA hydrolase
MTMIKIVCGLGNPGASYEHSRHNLGFDIVDRLAKQPGFAADTATPWFDYGTIPGAAGLVYVVRPTTYVNRSGVAVRRALDMFGAEPDELFVISDDFNLHLGTIRIRKSGSSGGHNGLQSIIDEIGRADFPRLRAGIGPLPAEYAEDPETVPEFVLSRFQPDEEETVAEILSRAVEAVALVIAGELDLAISKYNSHNPTPE